VPTIDDIVARMKRAPKGISFKDLAKVCEHYFGRPRSRGTSHLVFRTPWPRDPRVNIQDAKGRAKAYQVRQVLSAVEQLEKADGKSD